MNRQRLKESILSPQALFILLVALVSIWPRVHMAGYGHNFDLDSYQLVESINDSGKSVYANTERYNYGPIWFTVLHGLHGISEKLPGGSPEKFHGVIAAFLALADVLLAWLIARQWGRPAGLVYLFSPVSILQSGYHSQFDNFAILIGLVSWLTLIGREKPSWRRVALAGGLLGLSLSTKHILIFFPLWLAFLNVAGDWRKRAAYGAIGYAVFFALFLPWVFDPASRAGIKANVFGYSSELGSGLLYPFVSMFADPRAVDRWLSGVPVLGGIKLLWLALVLACGFRLRRIDPRLLVVAYLLAFFTFSPSLSTQYLVLALPACAIFYRSIPLALFQVTSVMVILTSVNAVYGMPPLQLEKLVAWLQEHLGYVPAGFNSQAWILVFLAGALAQGALGRPAPPPTEAAAAATGKAGEAPEAPTPSPRRRKMIGNRR